MTRRRVFGHFADTHGAFAYATTPVDVQSSNSVLKTDLVSLRPTPSTGETALYDRRWRLGSLPNRSSSTIVAFSASSPWLQVCAFSERVNARLSAISFFEARSRRSSATVRW